MAGSDGFPLRPLSPDDHEAAAALLALDEEHGTGRHSHLGVSDLRAWLTGVDLATDTWLYEEDGRLLAFGWHEALGDVSFGIGVVHPDARGRGLGSTLVATAERRAQESGRNRLHYGVLATDEGAPELLIARGFHEVRRFFEMGIELDGPPPEPVLPEGFVIETFDAEHARAFHGVLDESFRDHWEHQSRPFDAWWAQRSGAPDFDPKLWFFVRDGDELAGVIRSEPNRNGGGYVAALGVRRPWRGRGLGRALLLHTFGEFYGRGVTRITLGVDAESPTGATKLYESAGMMAELEQVVFEKALA